MNNFASKYKKSNKQKPKLERVENYKKPKIKNLAPLQQIEESHLGSRLHTQNVTDYPDLPVGSIACIRLIQTTNTNAILTFSPHISQTTSHEPQRFDKDGNLNLYFVLGNDVKQFLSDVELRKMFVYSQTISTLNAYCACLFNGEIIPVKKSSLIIKKRIDETKE